jgi:hypothetical protein
MLLAKNSGAPIRRGAEKRELAEKNEDKTTETKVGSGPERAFLQETTSRTK